MDFRLTEELQMLKDMAYKFGQSEIAPAAHEADEKEMYTPEIRMKAAENGLLGAWIPTERKSRRKNTCRPSAPVKRYLPARIRSRMPARMWRATRPGP